MKRIILLCMVLCGAVLPAAPLRAAEGDSVFGINSHVTSRHARFETLAEPANLIKSLKPGWVREDVQWARIEKAPGRFDWSWQDRVIELHRGNGLNIIGVITPAVGWATPEPSDQPDDVTFFPPDPDLYAAFVRRVAERYKGQVQAWEIWNEPENGLHWRPAPDPAAYARLLIKASAAIKSVDPNVLVLNGGVVPFDPSFLNALAANGAWNAFDVLSVHPYVDPYTPENAQIDAVGILNVKTLAAKYGTKPIWATEFGWGSGACERDTVGRTNEETQANYLVRAAAMLRGAGAERVLWYNFKDRAEPCYGLVRTASGNADYSQLKPAANAFRVLSEQVAGAQPLGWQEVMPNQQVLSFEDGAGWGAPFPVGKPQLVTSPAQAHGGRNAAQITYQFDGAGNDYVAFPRTTPTPLPAQTTKLGLWVYGDTSGHMIFLRVKDEQGEVLQFRMGFIGAPGWQLMTASLSGEVEPGNRLTGGNGRLDGALQLTELVVDDNPNEAAGSGTIFVDDLIGYQGGEVYTQRFQKGGGVVDVVWSPTGSSVQLPTSSAAATVVERDGGSRTVNAEAGVLRLNVGPAPIYVQHVPGSAQPPAPQPPAPPVVPGGSAPKPYDGQFASPDFTRIWERTDRPIAEGRLAQPRTWLWGPQPATAAHQEPYNESPGGMRLVQYFDKTRMEINNPANPQVTNGLLVVEMIEGRVQVGDATFVDARPAEQAVAGDPTEVNPTGPTYASFRTVAFPVNRSKAPQRIGQTATAVLGRDGTASEDAGLARYGVTIGAYDDTLGHNVPKVFTDFFAQRGIIYDGTFREGSVIDAIFAMGLPISEPYWARVKVAGVERDVLMQAFQRRVVTYTPSNSAGFQVEMGNVGQHYLRWRYGP